MNENLKKIEILNEIKTTNEIILKGRKREALKEKSGKNENERNEGKKKKWKKSYYNFLIEYSWA